MELEEVDHRIHHGDPDEGSSEEGNVSVVPMTATAFSIRSSQSNLLVAETDYALARVRRPSGKILARIRCH